MFLQEGDSLRYRRLDENGDFTFGQGQQNLLSDVDAVAQAILTRLKLLYSEWWENQTDGLPLWEKILGTTGKNIRAVDSIIRERIAGTLNVTSIESFTSDFDSEARLYTFVCVVNTAYGQVTVTNEVI